MYLFCISCKEIVATIKVPTLVLFLPVMNSPYVRNSRIELYNRLYVQGDCFQLHGMSGVIEESILAEKMQLPTDYIGTMTLSLLDYSSSMVLCLWGSGCMSSILRRVLHRGCNDTCHECLP